jgi:hypothetical protein
MKKKLRIPAEPPPIEIGHSYWQKGSATGWVSGHGGYHARALHPYPNVRFDAIHPK